MPFPRDRNYYEKYEIQEFRKFLLIESKLDSTFASLGGEAQSCVKFLGITAFDSNPKIARTESQSAAQNSPFLYLIFMRAKQGPIMGFLENHLKDLDFIESWKRVLWAIDSIASGIGSLHDHGVLHRSVA